MKEKYNIDIATINIIYKKYKQHLVYIGIMVICFIVFIFFTIPKISQISEVEKQRKAEEEKLKVLKNNIDILQNTDNSMLDSQLESVSSALPETKDYVGILNAISLASSKSGVSLSNYSFAVGGLSDPTVPETGYPYISLKLNIQANQTQSIDFLKNISETVPLSQISSVTQAGGNTSISLVFYYKSSVPENISESTVLTNLSQDDKELISTISTWNASFISLIPDNSASNSSNSTYPLNSSPF